MRTLPVGFSAIAEADIDSIEWWIGEQAASEIPARRYGARLRARCMRIGHAPVGGVARPDLQPDMRMAVFERSVTILYRVEPERVLILRILRAGRDVEAAART